MGDVRLVTRGLAMVITVWTAALGARSLAARRSQGRAVGQPVPAGWGGEVVDVGDRLWRGPAPTPHGYQELADGGVSLIVDLRAEADPTLIRKLAEQSGLDVIWLPSDNARAPHPDHVERFAQGRARTDGITYVHCQAGEGRTGALIGAYQIARGAGVADTIRDALAVGSLTFAQLAFVATGGRAVALPRVLEWTIDRPTEALFDLAVRRRGSSGRV